MNSPQVIVLGITGGIACGKTEAGRILSTEGFKVLDCDVLAHELMGKGQAVYSKVVEQFGDSILNEEKEIDREKLGKKVFSDPQARNRLNQLVHPAVVGAARNWIHECRGKDAAVLVPLLFEVGWTKGWDAVVCITAPEEQIFQRLEKRGLSNEEAHERIAAQMPLAEKAAQSDFVIENSGTIEALREQIVEIVQMIRQKKKEEI